MLAGWDRRSTCAAVPFLLTMRCMPSWRCRGARTDANVYCTLFGALGHSDRKHLDDSKNNFERGRQVSGTRRGSSRAKRRYLQRAVSIEPRYQSLIL